MQKVLTCIRSLLTDAGKARANPLRRAHHVMIARDFHSNGERGGQAGGHLWRAPEVEHLQKVLPQYEILQTLGKGGMGAVYKARQKSLKRLVAIKILPPEAADDELKFIERFQNEAQTMAQMNHPAIVSVYDFGETANGLLYFVMEFVDGTDVQQMIHSSGRLSEEHAITITVNVCEALHYAHARGVIHRDIKPANILINCDGGVKVADFGLAKMHDPSRTSGLTHTHLAMGTPDYVAPEALINGVETDHRADLYAVGVMLYQMLTGEVPRGMFKLPSEKTLGVDPRFDEIICKAMETDRDERYQSALDVREALDEILTAPQPKTGGLGAVSADEVPPGAITAKPRPPGRKITGLSTASPPIHTAPSAPLQYAGDAAKTSVITRTEPVSPAKNKSKSWLALGGIAVLGAAALVMFFLKSGSPVAAEKASAKAKASGAPVQQQPTALGGQTKSLEAGNIKNWQDVTVEAREKARRMSTLLVEKGDIRLAPGASVPRQRILLTPPGGTDYALRLRYTGKMQVDLRVQDGVGFYFVYSQTNQTIFKRQMEGMKESDPLRTGALHPAGFDPDQEHEFIVAMKGSLIRAWLDGRFVGECRDEILKQGEAGVHVGQQTVLRSAEIADLSATPDN